MTDLAALSLARQCVALRPARGEVWTWKAVWEWNRLWDEFVKLVPDVKEQDRIYLEAQEEK